MQKTKLPQHLRAELALREVEVAARWPTASDLHLERSHRWFGGLTPAPAFEYVRRLERELGAAYVEERSSQAWWNSSRLTFHEKKRRAAHLPNGLATGSAIHRDISAFIHQLVLITRPHTSGETGFASGTSAVAAMSAEWPNATHYAIDPFQPAFASHGLRAVRGLADAFPTSTPRFVHVNETASFGLAWLARRSTCLDFFFMDDGHKFDDNLAELYTVSKLLSIGGVLMLHDTWLPSVRKTMSFIRTNLRFLEPMNASAWGSHNLRVYVKRAPDRRGWKDFIDF